MTLSIFLNANRLNSRLLALNCSQIMVSLKNNIYLALLRVECSFFTAAPLPVIIMKAKIVEVKFIVYNEVETI